MANLDQSYEKHFDKNITVFNAVRESKVLNLHVIGTQNYNQSGGIITNMIGEVPLLGTYLLSKDIARHFAKIEKDISKCYDYFDDGGETLAYNKLNLTNGDALTDEHIMHIEDGVLQVDEKIEEVKASLTNMDEVKASLVSALKTKGFVSANTDMSFDELIALVKQI